MPRNSVGPTAEYNTASLSNISYGDAVPTARRHLNVHQWPKRINVATATPDNGWIGPLGVSTPFSPSGSIYGYGATPDWPQY